MSTSSFTRGAFGSDLIHNSLDLLHSHRFARKRAEIPRHLKEIALIAVFPNFARDQLTQVGSIEQAFRARFRRDFLWQIEFDRDAHDNSTVTETNTGCQVKANSALKHHHQEAEFYADVLSHLLKNKLKLERKVVLNIAERGASTRNANLQLALLKAVARFEKTRSVDHISSLVVFNVQNHRTEPLLNIADYLCWSVQRIFERGETRYYDFMGDKIRLVVDLYDSAKYEGSLNYYRGKRRLTA